ncbi:MAG: hypothetical protein NVSMB20_10410 [Bradyrhizobium sp.]
MMAAFLGLVWGVLLVGLPFYAVWCLANAPARPVAALPLACTESGTG